MSFESRFSEQEQVLLSSLPTLIGSVMSLAEGSGLGTIKEMISSTTTMMSGAKDFSTNEIVKGVLPSMENREEAIEDARQLRDKIKSHLQGYQAKSKDDLKARVIEDCKKVDELLATKADPKEAEEYKTWTLNIAENVAKAASEGGFLGFGGTQVSSGETKLFQDIASALHVTRSMN